MVNAPGNDVFDSHDVPRESKLLRAQLLVFKRVLHEAQTDLETKVSADNAAPLTASLALVDQAMNDMVEEAELIFTLQADGDYQAAGNRMAAMDRKYAGVTTAIALMGNTGREIVRTHLNAQNASAESLKTAEFLIAGFVVCMVLGVTLYGRKISRTMKQLSAETQEHLFALKQKAAELENANQALEKATIAPEAASDAKSEFLANVSYELRTPLTLILGPLDSVLAGRSSDLPGDVRVDLERVQRNTARLFGLVNDVLDFSKAEAGEMTAHWQAVDVVQHVASAVEGAQPAAKAKNIQLAFVADGELGTVPLDRRMFEKILFNLVGNALKFTPSGGRVDVSLRSEDDDFELAVTDTGPGIGKEELKHLFQRFRQLDGSSTRQHEGTGLGLSLVKEFAGQMGGQVGVESKLGEGSRFFVHLPKDADRLARLDEQGSTPADDPGSTSDFKRLEQELQPLRQTHSSSGETTSVSGTAPKPRILIADDNADMREHIRNISTSDFEVEAVDNGRKALGSRITGTFRAAGSDAGDTDPASASLGEPDSRTRLRVSQTELEPGIKHSWYSCRERGDAHII